jgi:hypothetical protein
MLPLGKPGQAQDICDDADSAFWILSVNTRFSLAEQRWQPGSKREKCFFCRSAAEAVGGSGLHVM